MRLTFTTTALKNGELLREHGRSGSRSRDLERTAEERGQAEKGKRHEIVPREFLLQKQGRESYEDHESDSLLNDLQLEVGRSYVTVTQDLTRVMNRLKAVYRSWAIPCAGQEVYSPRHRAVWLEKLREAGVRRRAEQR